MSTQGIPYNPSASGIQTRPKIDIGLTGMGRKITHNGTVCRVVMKRGVISVGCSDISIDAARELLKIYDDKFGPEEVVVQE